MDKADVLRTIETYLKENGLAGGVAEPRKVPVAHLLNSSLDVLEFVMHLEEALGLEKEIDLDELGPRLARDLTVEQLADEIVRFAGAQA